MPRWPNYLSKSAVVLRLTRERQGSATGHKEWRKYKEIERVIEEIVTVSLSGNSSVVLNSKSELLSHCTTGRNDMEQTHTVQNTLKNNEQQGDTERVSAESPSTAPSFCR